MTINVINQGAIIHCWSIVQLDDKFKVLSPDGNTQFTTKDYKEAINWCNEAFAAIPQEFIELVEKKKDVLLKEHLSEFKPHYKNVYNTFGVLALSKEVYDFTAEYSDIRYELKLDNSRNDYDYLSYILKTHIINLFTASSIIYSSK